MSCLSDKQKSIHPVQVVEGGHTQTMDVYLFLLSIDLALTKTLRLIRKLK